MPSLPPRDIVNAIIDAFMDAGASAILLSGERSHPRQFYVSAGDTSFPVWIYVWTLTHGGGQARPRDEYRIQLTSVTPPLMENPDGPTLLLGYEPDTKSFAGFDLTKHREFSTKSPSIQININALRESVRNGFSFTRKGNDEIAIGFRSDNILAYSLNADDLHRFGADANVSTLLEKVGRLEQVSPTEVATVPKERRRILSQVSKLVRDSNFRRKVTVAYDRKCAVTGLQLRLIDAAHILPVGADGSVDEVTNGICLSPTYHRAYDRGLITLEEDYRMVINPSKKRELVALGLGGGLREFEAPLGREILLPADRRQWPDVSFIRARNSFQQR